MRPLSDFTAWPKFSVFDIEAENWVDVTCLCHLDEFGNTKQFNDVSSYVDWLFSKQYEGELVWSHWGGHYDQRFIIWEVSKRGEGWDWQAMVSGNLIIILVVRDPHGRTIKFCESARLMPDSVAKIGKTVGIEKLDVDRRKIESYTRDQVIEYCYRDCEIVLKGLQAMRKILLGIGCDFGFTLASIATRYVRRTDVLDWFKFYEKDPATKKLRYRTDMLDADKFCLPAFFGGRVEVFRKGRHRDLYYYDITSSYPWSMTHELPAYFTGFKPPLIKSRTLDGRTSVTTNVEASLRRCGVSEATIYMPDDRDWFYAPPLPWRQGNKVTFPIIQNERGRWTNLELLELWERGKSRGVKIEIHGQAVFEPMPFVRSFVETFFNMRLEAIAEKDEFRTYAFKILLNSLYGKLIETSIRRSVLYGEMVDEAIEKFGAYDVDKGVGVEPSPCPGAYFLTTESDGPFRHVAAGSYVTARSRLLLLHGINKAREAGARVYYCDTDSLITDQPIFGFHSAKRLGDFNLETTISEAEIFSSKVYKLITPKGIIYKAKGMPISSKDWSEAESAKRWALFTAPFQRGLEDAEKPIKEGIRGFLSDIRSGTLQPSSFKLARQMKEGDSKRTHGKEGDSEPLVWISQSEVA
jgi:DNA polymerase family B